MRQRAQAGEIELAYLDEAGFAQVHPNRSAWTRRGQQHRIHAPRGKRLNVMAAWLHSGKVVPAQYWHNTNAEVFLGFINHLHEQVGRKPLVVVLDNARIHKAQAIQLSLKLLQEQGVTLYFLPAYSPELNRIEVLWHTMKHRWLQARYRTKETLEHDIRHIFENFGDRYQLAVSKLKCNTGFKGQNPG